MIETKQRIRIIGPPGSYITDLAQALADQTGRSYINLPDIEKQPHPITLLQTMLKGEKWIVCGSIVHDWAEHTLNDATMVLFIHTDRRICFIRLCLRLLLRFYSYPAWKRFFLDLRVLRKFNVLLENWKEKHANIQRKVLSFETVDEAYSYYIKKSAPDLFL